MFANFVFVQTFVETTLRAWIGPSGKILQIGFRLQRFNVAGTELTCGGEVIEVNDLDGEIVVKVAIWVHSDGIATNTGTARVLL
jgi:hypothetical protein